MFRNVIPHIHWHNTVVLVDEPFEIRQCRCGHNEHYIDWTHRYSENVKPQAIAQSRFKMLAQFGQYDENE